MPRARTHIVLHVLDKVGAVRLERVVDADAQQASRGDDQAVCEEEAEEATKSRSA